MTHVSWRWIDRTSWIGLAALCVACGFQAIRLAGEQYDLALRDPNFRIAAPETANRINRAAELEIRGDRRAAEHELLLAAANDRRFLPAWALANFYHRQGRLDDFWTWAKRASELSYGDRASLFALLLDAGSPDEALTRALPPSLTRDFGAYLLSTGRLVDAAKILSPEERSLNLTLCDRFIAVRQFDQALAIWNRSQDPKLDPSRPTIVNGDFASPPAGLGFDWRLAPGVTHRPGGLEVNLEASGRELFSQYLVLDPNRRYTLTVEDDGFREGLEWQIDGQKYTADTKLKQLTYVFETAADRRIFRLSLNWRGGRPGFYALRRVSLEPAS